MHLTRGPMSVRSSALAATFALAAPAALVVGAPFAPRVHAAEPALPAGSASSAASSAPGASSASSKAAPGEVEIVDVTEDPVRSPQWLAVGLALGAGYLTIKTDAGHGSVALDAAIHIDFGLGPGGDPTRWSLGPYLAAAFVPFGSNPVPNRFAELGARLVRRFEAPMWVSLGLGLAVTNRQIVLPADQAALCASGKTAAVQCGTDRNILGAVLDLGVGLYEARARSLRWGVGARVPVQISAHPGIGAFLFVYGSVGVGR